MLRIELSGKIKSKSGDRLFGLSGWKRFCNLIYLIQNVLTRFCFATEIICTPTVTRNRYYLVSKCYLIFTYLICLRYFQL